MNKCPICFSKDFIHVGICDSCAKVINIPIEYHYKTANGGQGSLLVYRAFCYKCRLIFEHLGHYILCEQCFGETKQEK